MSLDIRPLSCFAFSANVERQKKTLFARTITVQVERNVAMIKGPYVIFL